MADSNIQTLDTVKPITLDEYQERTAHLQENTTSLLSTIADRQVQAAGLATQAASLASEVNAVAEQASLSFSKKTWTDTATSGTPITAAELNRLENAISSLTTAVNNLQDSVSKAVVTAPADGVTCVSIGRIVVVQLKNISLTAHTGRTVCQLPFKPVTEAFGCLNVNSASGYVKIDTNGVVSCFSTTSGDFSGQAVICT